MGQKKKVNNACCLFTQTTRDYKCKFSTPILTAHSAFSQQDMDRKKKINFENFKMHFLMIIQLPCLSTTLDNLTKFQNFF